MILLFLNYTNTCGILLGVTQDFEQVSPLFVLSLGLSVSAAVSVSVCQQFSPYQMGRIASTLRHPQLGTEPMDVPAFTHD